MSIMRCDRCDAFVDTDDAGYGLFEDANPYRFWCESCVTSAFDDADPTDAIVATMKAQDPATFKDLTETWA